MKKQGKLINDKMMIKASVGIAEYLFKELKLTPMEAIFVLNFSANKLEMVENKNQDMILEGMKRKIIQEINAANQKSEQKSNKDKLVG